MYLTKVGQGKRELLIVEIIKIHQTWKIFVFVGLNDTYFFKVCYFQKRNYAHEVN